MWAVIQGVKLAVHVGFKAVHIVADNLAAIWSAIRLTGWGVGNPNRARLLRRLMHVVRRSKIQVFLSWVPLKSIPADTPSRIFEYPNPVTMQADAWATYLVANNKPNANRVAMGWLGSGG